MNIKFSDQELAQILWNYHHMPRSMGPADAILILGNSDERTAERGGHLFQCAFAPFIVVSGGYGKITKDIWHVTEAEKFASVLVEMGVPEEQILLETKASNTGENIKFTRELLEGRGLFLKKLIVVTKPYMERRAYATFMKQWSGMDFIVTSPQISFDDYPNDELPFKRFVEVMVGDLQRIREYPKLGFQIEQEIPENVWAAYERLVQRGYTAQLIK